MEPQKKNGLRSIALSLIALGASCQTPNSFWTRNLTNQRSECIQYDKVAQGNFVEVYLEKGLSLSSFDLVRFTKDFDQNTYPKLISAFGPPSDVDGDGKIKVLVLDVRDGATPNSAYVAGFYDPINFFPDSIGSRIRSNFAEILYMDGKELIRSLSRDPSGFDATAAHEFQHLIRFPNMEKFKQTDDIWINEGTSEVASDLAGYGPQTTRIQCYLGKEDSRCANGINGVSLINWNDSSSSNEILKKYAFAYVYMRFLYDISGSNETERGNFFRQTVVGNEGNTRAVKLDGLLSLFRSSPGYNSNDLGTTNNEAFFRTFALLVGRSFGITDFSNVMRIPESGGTMIETLNLSSANTNYPFSQTLSSINVSNQILPTNAIGSLSASSANFYASNTPSLPTDGKSNNRGRILIPSSTKGVLFWGASPEFISAQTLSIKSFGSLNETPDEESYILDPEETNNFQLELDLNRLKKIITKNQSGSESQPHPICGFEFTDVPAHTDESIPIK